jgi:hypothetical protein
LAGVKTGALSLISRGLIWTAAYPVSLVIEPGSSTASRDVL